MSALSRLRFVVRCFTLAAVVSLLARTAGASGVDPTHISLPKGPGSIEGLASQDFVPSLSSGTASFSIPIAVPPGASGFGPSLSLAYDSGGGITEVGMGWRLSGVARIRRRIEEGLPRFDASDTFELLGVGIPSELLEVAPGTFRPEHEDGSFVRVQRSAGGKEWEARTKSGMTLRFGGDGFTESEAAHVSAYLLREQIDPHGHTIRYEWDVSDGYALLTRIVWNDFDAASTNEVVFNYQSRPDVHRWYANGMAQSFRRRLAHIDVMHGGALVRRYELEYDDDDLPHLTALRLVGNDGRTALPSARFEYTEAAFETDAGNVVTMQNPPGRSPGEPDAALTDLNGDGLPDLLIGTAGSYRSYINHDGRSWLPGEDWAAADSPSVSLSTLGVQLADVDADGAPDLLVKSGLDSFRYFPHPMGTHFDAPVTITTVPTFSFEDPNVRLADMDGDRRVDAIVTTTSGIAIGYNLGGSDWAEPAIVGVVDANQQLLFSDGQTQLCDVNGDRVQDLCHLRSGSLTYWLGRGRGLFDAGEEATGVPTFDVSAPYRLVDLNGDGWVDLVRVDVTSVSYALAVAEGQFGALHTLSGTPTKTTSTTIEFADMNGSGTTDILWVDVSGATDHSWRYLELFPEGRAGLLRRIDNGLGKVQTIDYKPAVLDAASARDDGSPWTTRMNIAMPVVSRVTVDSSLGDPPLVSEFTYRDGTYDPTERTFAAFAGGTVRELGDEHTPTLLTTSTFDTGLQERVLRGALLTEQTEDETGRVYSITTNAYTRRTLDPALNPASDPAVDGRAVRYAFKSSERVEHVEGQPSASRVTLTEIDEDDYGNVTEERRWGEVAGNDVLAGNDETIIERTYANNTEDWLLGFLASEETLDAAGNRLAMTRKYYDGEPFQGLPLGQVARGDVTREEAWAGPDLGNSAFELVNSTRYNSDGQPVETRDGRGGGRIFEWAGDHTSLKSERVKLETDVVLTEIAETDGAFGNLLAVTEYNGQTTHYEYDPFGRLTKVVRPGDTSDNPSVRYTYDASAPLSRVITESRADSDGTADDYDRSEQLFDGLGRKRGTLTRDGDRWVLAGVSLLDARGNAQRSLLPRFVGSAEHASPPLRDALPRGTDTWRDAIEREIRTRSSSGTESRTAYLPFETQHWDGGQNDPSSHYEHTPTIERVDGQSRTVEHVRTLNGTLLAARYTYDAAGRLTSRTDPEGNTATYDYDGRGRRLRVHDPDLGIYSFTYDSTGNVVERTYPDGIHARFTFDLAGRSLTEDWDGDGENEVENRWDTSDRDAGDPGNPGNPGNPLYLGKLAHITDPSGTVDHEYDERGRVTATSYTIDDKTYTVKSEYDAQDRERLHVYPDGSSIEIRRNARGQISGYGQAVDFEYDGDGLETARHFNTGVVVENAYDEDRRRNDLHILSAGGTVIEHLHWTYDTAGNLTKLDDLRPDVSPDRNRSETYEYDNLYRLRRVEGSWGSTEWRYSSSGNLLGRTSSISEQQLDSVSYGERPHAPRAFGDRAVEYDARGRMLGDGSRTYHWNAADQLESVTDKSGASVENRYSGDGVRRLRIERSAKGDEKRTIFLDAWSEVQDGKLVRYIFHGGQRIVRLADDNGTSGAAGVVKNSAETRKAGLAALIAFLAFIAAACRRSMRSMRWIVVPAAVIGLAACGGDAGPRAGGGTITVLSDKDTLLCTDLLGSLLSETSGNGTPKAAFAAYPFGSPRYDDSHETQKYAASPRDGAVQLDQMGARYYAPDLGVWSSGEPLAVTSPEDLVTDEFAAANPYAYSNLSPVIASDRDGHFWNIVAGILIGGGGEAARQYYQTGHISDPGRIAAMAAAGAVGGGISEIAHAAGWLTTLAVGAYSGAASGITERVIESGGKSAGSLVDVGVDAVVGAATAGLVKGGSSVVKRVLPRAPRVDFSSEKAWQRGYVASRRAGGGGDHVARVAQTERVVIGRGSDLAKPGALKPGEFKLSWPSKLPDFKAEWKMNSGLLREQMGRGLPIRDVSPDDSGGIFLNAERNLLNSRGWTFDPSSSQWMPPGG